MKLLTELNEFPRPKNGTKAPTIKNLKEKMGRVMKHQIYITEYRNDPNDKMASIYFFPADEKFEVKLTAMSTAKRASMNAVKSEKKVECKTMEDVITTVNKFLGY